MQIHKTVGLALNSGFELGEAEILKRSTSIYVEEFANQEGIDGLVTYVDRRKQAGGEFLVLENL